MSGAGAEAGLSHPLRHAVDQIFPMPICLHLLTYMTICSRSIPTLPSGLRPRSCPECMSILAQSPCLASPRPPERMAILTLQSTCLHSHPARLSA